VQRGAQNLRETGLAHLKGLERLPPEGPGGNQVHHLKHLGEHLMALTFEHKVGRVHVRLALVNRFVQLRRPTTVAAGPQA